MASPREYLEDARKINPGNPRTSVLPKEDAKFKPAESAGMAAPARPIADRAAQAGGMVATNMTRQQISDAANPMGQVAPNQPTIYPAVGRAAVAVGNRVANDAVALGRDVAAGVEASKPVVRQALRGSEWANADALNPSAPRVAMPAPASVQPNRPTVQTPQPMSVEREMQFRRANANQAGMRAMDEGGPQMTPEQVRETILRRNGLKGNEVPATARPGNVLAATEATPRKPLPYTGAFADGGPEVKAEDALQRKQMEVMQAERNNKGLLYGPGSRDYISPTLSPGQQRARQAEIAEQRKKDVEDVAAQQVANATVKMMDDQAKGITSDRNLAMMPYAQRRAVINDRNALMGLNAADKNRRSEEAVSEADRAAEMERAQMTDATTRRGQDVGLESDAMREAGATGRAQMADSTMRRGQDVAADSNRATTEAQSRDKALDRQNRLDVEDRKQRTQPVDRVKLENIKAYNKHVSDRLTMNPELQNDPVFFENALKTFNLTAEDLKSQIMASANPYDDEEFPTI